MRRSSSCAHQASRSSIASRILQSEALGVALGLRAGQAPNTFLVGLAVLGLLSEAAGERPHLCVVDDAEWLDQASARVLRSWHGACWPRRSRFVFAARQLSKALEGYQSFRSSRWATGMRVRSWSPPCQGGWMSVYWNASSSRRTGIRSRCWSCHAA